MPIMSKDKNNQRGYTLISVALSLMIIGILIAGFAQTYKVYDQREQLILNEQRISTALLKIQSYRQLYGRIPCPSSINTARNTASYGMESDCSDTTTITTGSCLSGICVVNGARTITPPAAAAYIPRVRIGAIPFRVLQMDEKETIDAYGNRILYAMTEELGVQTTYSEINGGINIINELGDNIIDPTGSANFALVSAGPNKRGSFNIDGLQANACTGASLDVQNCIDLSSPPATATLASSVEALAGGASEFDDTIDYFAALADTRWRRTEGNQDDIEAIVLDNVSAGITTSPTDKLHISQSPARPAAAGVSATWEGALRATVGLQAENYCDESGNNCFDVEDFMGSSSAMTCPTAGEYVIGIEGDSSNPGHAKVKCAPVRIFCSNPATPIFDGVYPWGAPKCKTLSVNCTTANIQICNSAYTAFNLLPSNAPSIPNPTSTGAVTAATGAYINVTDPGSYPTNPAKAWFQCNNGVWNTTVWTSGLCSCNPTPPPSSTCTTSPTPSPACTGSVSCTGAGTGFATQNYSFNAFNCQWTGGSISYATCSCPSIPPTAPPAPVACAAGYNSGWAVPSYHWNSNPNVCAWVADPGNCGCTAPVPATRDGALVACSAISGFEGFTGTAIKKEVFNSTLGICGWQFSHYDTSACTCDSTTEHISTNVHATTCTPCQNETSPAVWKYKFDGPGCSRGPDYISTLPTCQAKNFFWRLNMTGFSTFGAASNGGNPEIGVTTCSCSEWGASAQSVCGSPAVGATWNIGMCTCRE